MALSLSACGTSPEVVQPPVVSGVSSVSGVSTPNATQIPAPVQSAGLTLRDGVIYDQKDARWASDPLGRTSDTMGGQGCLVTAASMALTNLGFQTNPKDLNQRLTQTEYPMVQFYLPNGRSHWAMIVRHDARGYHMRDPLRISEKPLIFPAGISGYRAVRCIGLASG